MLLVLVDNVKQTGNKIPLDRYKKRKQPSCSYTAKETHAQCLPLQICRRQRFSFIYLACLGQAEKAVPQNPKLTFGPTPPLHKANGDTSNVMSKAKTLQEKQEHFLAFGTGNFEVGAWVQFLAWTQAHHQLP